MEEKKERKSWTGQKSNGAGTSPGGQQKSFHREIQSQERKEAALENIVGQINALFPPLLRTSDKCEKCWYAAIQSENWDC